MIALTFDDGPGPATSGILDTLKDYALRASFFVVGRNVLDCPWTSVRTIGRMLVKRALLEGHVVGNHTLTHSRCQSEEAFTQEVYATDAIINEVRLDLGLPVAMPHFRLPFGVLNQDPRLGFCGALGRSHVHWSKQFDDWHEGPIARLLPEIIAYVEEREAAGLNSVLDLHDGGIGGLGGYDRSATADAVRGLLEEASMRGWRFFAAPCDGAATRPKGLQLRTPLPPGTSE